MKHNKIQEIYTRLATDQAFAEELKKFAEGKQIASLEEDAAAFIEFAKLQGYEITIDELKAFAEDKYKALSEEELDSVNAAGAGGFSFDPIPDLCDDNGNEKGADEGCHKNGGPIHIIFSFTLRIRFCCAGVCEPAGRSKLPGKPKRPKCRSGCRCLQTMRPADIRSN